MQASFLKSEGRHSSQRLAGPSALCAPPAAAHPSPGLQPVRDGLLPLPAAPFPQPPPRRPAELRQHGRREEQNGRCRRRGGDPPPDEPLLARVARGGRRSDPRWRIPEDRRRGDGRGSQGPTEVQQDERNEQPDPSRRPLGLEVTLRTSSSLKNGPSVVTSGRKSQATRDKKEVTLFMRFTKKCVQSFQSKLLSYL